jgi:hypothetical protein
MPLPSWKEARAERGESDEGLIGAAQRWEDALSGGRTQSRLLTSAPAASRKRSSSRRPL